MKVGNLFILGVAVLGVAACASASEPLTFEERVKAQEAVERVFFAHRIWPKENPLPKPPFEQMVSRAILEAKVRDTLKKSVALDVYWQRSITGEQLQAEMERMARETKDATTLRELFAALGNDPLVIAECLVRSVLAERLLQSEYSRDEMLHRDTKSKAQRALASTVGSSLSLCPEGNYQKMAYILRASGEGAAPRENDRGTLPQEGFAGGEIAVDSERFERELQQCPNEGKPTILRETPEAFILIRTALKTSTRLEVETLVFPKQDLREWLRTFEPNGLVRAISSNGYQFALPPGPQSNCNPDTWAPTFTGTNCPSGREWHAAVWTGTDMIVWGGWDGATYLNTGGRYNPALDAWMPTSTGANCPYGRYNHTAIWTGTEMIVWGGYRAGYTNTGGRYNPSSDSWTPTSTAIPRPSSRSYHTAVWTGTEMIIWGGVDASNSFNTGGRYNPSADSWTETSTGTNCPSARCLHITVWTGSRMIVWGGFSMVNGIPQGLFNDGGSYNPSTDLWTATAMVSVPSARVKPAVVWTGTEMIVWGGEDDAGAANTGGRYNPSTGTWAPTSTGTYCPTPRKHHTAIWTGSEMIVWGGDGNTGGRYNPSGNTWMPTSTGTNCPVGRDDHTAVWTGTQMVVWGGYYYDGTDQYLNTGGQYFTGVPEPVPATSLAWTGAGKNTLSWSAATCATGYRVYRGVPSELVNLSTGAQACISYDGASATTGATLAANPPAGSFYWYLAVGYDASGEGSAGYGGYAMRMIISTGACP